LSDFSCAVACGHRELNRWGLAHLCDERFSRDESPSGRGRAVAGLVHINDFELHGRSADGHLDLDVEK